MLDKIKSLDKKTLYLFGGMILLPIILIIVLVIVRGCSGGTVSYSEYENKMISASEKYFKKKKILPTSEGETAEVSLSKLVKGGYIKSSEDLLEDSSCKGTVIVRNNGESIKENEGGYYLYSVNLECKDYSTETLSDNIIKNVVTSGAGLYQTENGYIFKGETDASKKEYVNNYITFFGRDYRIISIDSNGDLRLIKTEQERNSGAWDNKYNEIEKKAYGENKYADSSILKRLVADYNTEKKIKKEAKKYIVAKDICVDLISTTNGSLTNNGCQNILKNQVIGLIDIRDFAIASLDPDCNSIYSRSCRNYNYMREFLDITWTSSAVAENTYQAYYMNQGMPKYEKTSSTKRYYIVINISGNITNFEGDGSLENPYVIK